MTKIRCDECELSELCEKYDLKGVTKEECSKMFRQKKDPKKGK